MQHRSVARNKVGASAEARARSPQSLRGGASLRSLSSPAGDCDPPEIGSVREALGLPEKPRENLTAAADGCQVQGFSRASRDSWTRLVPSSYSHLDRMLGLPCNFNTTPGLAGSADAFPTNDVTRSHASDSSPAASPAMARRTKGAPSARQSTRPGRSSQHTPSCPSSRSCSIQEDDSRPCSAGALPADSRQEAIVRSFVRGTRPASTAGHGRSEKCDNGNPASGHNWQRPGSAPAGAAALPWSSPGIRFCTPLRA